MLFSKKICIVDFTSVFLQGHICRTYIINTLMATITDTDIVSALQEDTEKGFRLLMQKYKYAVYWHIRRLVVSHDDAQDASQEAFIRMFRSFDKFKGKEALRQKQEASSLGAWIYRIATNEALRILQRRREGQLSLETTAAEN